MPSMRNRIFEKNILHREVGRGHLAVIANGERDIYIFTRELSGRQRRGGGGRRDGWVGKS